MRNAQNLVEKAELVHQLESGRVDGIAAEIAKKVCVFFEEEDFDASAGEEEAEHHAGGAAAYDAARSLYGLRGCFRRHDYSLGLRVCHRFKRAGLQRTLALLVNLQDAVMAETVLQEMVELMASTREERVPHPCKNRKDGLKGETLKAKRAAAPLSEA